MTVQEFRGKIIGASAVIIENIKYDIKEVVKFRFDDGSHYFKCFLSGGYVLADDLKENFFILVKEVKTIFIEPFPQRLKFNDQEFDLSYSAHALAEEVWGEQIFAKGEGESFTDYQSAGGDYLSLGKIDSTKKRLDFFGKILFNDKLLCE